MPPDEELTVEEELPASLLLLPLIEEELPSVDERVPELVEERGLKRTTMSYSPWIFLRETSKLS